MMIIEKPITLVLISKDEEQKSLRCNKMWIDSFGKMHLQLLQDHEIQCFVISQTEEGITELIDEVGKLHRISGISYGNRIISEHEVEYEFLIGGSYQKGLNLMNFIELQKSYLKG
ncbi:hypothetical protein ACI48J_03550 [Paenibacillus chitinolyticus]|uniref:hypothetical protein n=1 Tax=Paenibacillus chitinolyticus TaxID=79263 RepID=UPI00386E2B4F